MARRYRTTANVKKGVAILLWLMSAGFVFNIQIIKDLLMDYAFISVMILIVAGALLWFQRRYR